MTASSEVGLIEQTKTFGRAPGGSYCCLLSPSGSGKTTTLRMIAGRHHRRRCARDASAAGATAYRADVSKLRSLSAHRLGRQRRVQPAHAPRAEGRTRMKARDAPPCRNGNPGGAAPFDRPGTAFVAPFIGGHNLPRCTVE